MFWSSLEAPKIARANSHTLSSSHEQVAVAFKRQGATKCSLVTGPRCNARPPTSAVPVLKGKLRAVGISGWRAKRGHIDEWTILRCFILLLTPGVESESTGSWKHMGWTPWCQPGKDRLVVMDYLNIRDELNLPARWRSRPRVLKELEPLALIFENPWRAARTREKCQASECLFKTVQAEKAGGRTRVDPMKPAGPILKLAWGSTEQSLSEPSFTYCLYSSSLILTQKVSRTLLSSHGWTRPVLLTSRSSRALITVLMFLKICV